MLTFRERNSSKKLVAKGAAIARRKNSYNFSPIIFSLIIEKKEKEEENIVSHTLIVKLIIYIVIQVIYICYSSVLID